MNIRSRVLSLAALIAVLCVAPVTVRAEDQRSVIDTPTTGMLGYGCYDLNFRLFSGGGILTRLNFGVFKIVNLGLGWEVNNAVGKENVVVGPPTLHLKIKPFAGGMILPAFAIGYDGQGNFYDKDRSEFIEKEKGIFIVFGRETLFPGLEMHFGANMNDFKTNTVFGFANMTINIEDTVVLLAEYDRVNYLPDSRLNAGIRFFVTDDLSIDLAARDIGAGTDDADPAKDRRAERIIRVSYTGKF